MQGYILHDLEHIQERVFKEKGFLLKKMNHSVWFRYDDFHTNSIEGLWPQLKRVSHYYTGISVTKLKETYDTETDKIKYKWLDDFFLIIKGI